MSSARGSRPGDKGSESTDHRVDRRGFIVVLSKLLCRILRHAATKERIPMADDGFVALQALLSHRKFLKYTLDDIKMVVETNDKQRFTMREDPTSGWQIRANQGHSFEVKNLDLTPILDAAKYPTVIHGTHMANWNSIKESGLRRMKRVHIHMAAGIPGESGIISGMRASADVIVTIDMQKAINDGIPFFVSENNVILSPGNDRGVLEPKYFSKVINRKTGHILTS